jgi:MYXO-CTERM domain-containing protein
MTLIQTTLGALGLATTMAVAPAMADDTGLFDWDSYEDSSSGSSSSGATDITAAETSFKGALMLKGDIDVTFGEITSGVLEDDDNFRYAFFSGNTLYAGVEDREGNTSDMIVEFFWFESSIDRGSDFWVAVVKARTTPNLEEGWKLEVEDSPVLSLHAETYNEMDNSGFRWDWSLPFESYGWDAYGSVTMESSYGLATNAEGAAMVAYEQKESADGVTEEVQATVQAKCYLNDSFQIQTKYQITLWRWEMMVQGTPADMDWDLYLDSWDRQDQNAYHEYMMVMQADEGKGFSLERLELSGTVTDPHWYWFDSDSTMSIAINDIQISRPDVDLEDYQDNNNDNNGDNQNNDEDDTEQEEGPEVIDEENTGSTSTTNINVEMPAQPASCSTSTGNTAPLGLALALGLVAMGRRRDD